MLNEVRARYERLLEWIVILLMAVLAVEVTVGVVFRTFGAALVWYDEIAAILLAWLTFYGSALASAKRAHIGCPEVVAMLPARGRVFFRVLADLLTVAFFLVMGWTGYTVLEVLGTDNLVSLPQVTVAWVQSVVPISAALIILAEVLSMPAAVARARAGRSAAQTGEASH